MNTNFFFEPGKLSFIMDGGAGSSGKGKVGSFVAKHADNWQFCCNTFYPQAGHHVYDHHNGVDGHWFYQTLNSCAYLHEKFEKLYIGPGSIIELPALLQEIEDNGIPRSKIGISPVVAVLDDSDSAFERGEVDLDGNRRVDVGEGTMKFGSTCHGVGACRAKKVLRRPNVKLARDIPEITDMLCDVSGEIMSRLDSGQAGLCEIAQGFQLSINLPEFYPYTTSRNCSIMAGLDDMMIPPKYAGNVILNFRTYPIRISNKKYIGEDGSHLTWEDVQNGVPHEEKIYSSGPGYDDQKEITWEELTQISGSPDPIMEMTSVTKLPRRVFTFSVENLKQAIKYNDTGSKIYISINFANYVDYALTDMRYDTGSVSDKFRSWIDENITPAIDEINEAKNNSWTGQGSWPGSVELKFIGTGRFSDEMLITGE
jgi:adenylosuccinate synthase